MSLFSLNEKTAVITGASRGIGKSIARLFARQGAEVHVLDLDEAEGEKTVQEILSENGRAHFHRLDVTRQKDAVELLDEIYRKRDRLDILVNNAGRAHIGTLEQTTEEAFDMVYEVNVKGVYNCSFAAVRNMKRTGGGVILNIASIAAGLGISDRFAYSMSKGAVLTMTYSIAKDYLDEKIRCNAISPARVHTPFVDGYLKENYRGQEEEMFEKLSKTQPIGRMGKPEEVAHLALYLCSDEAGFLTGTNYPIDGGFIKLNS